MGLLWVSIGLVRAISDHQPGWFEGTIGLLADGQGSLALSVGINSAWLMATQWVTINLGWQTGIFDLAWTKGALIIVQPKMSIHGLGDGLACTMGDLTNRSQSA
ncbi:hypothetical protein AAC387_Pa09g2352 [Persea americana]